MERRCDEYSDCRDDHHSDETGCEVLIIDNDSYRKEYPPVATRGKKLHVSVNIRVMDLSEIAEVRMSYRVKFKISLGWFDPRLKFTNLKSHFTQNVIGVNKRNSVWMPPLIFNNSAKNQIVSSDPNTPQRWFIDRRGEARVAPPSVLDETYFYAGSENMLIFEAEYDLIFFCKFRLECYPFDTQICTLEVSSIYNQNKIEYIS